MPVSTKRLAEIEAVPDEAIDAADIPELNEAFFKTARLTLPGGASKKSAPLRLDEAVLAWFKAQGKGHRTRMNAILRAYMIAESRRGSEGD